MPEVFCSDSGTVGTPGPGGVGGPGSPTSVAGSMASVFPKVFLDTWECSSGLAQHLAGTQLRGPGCH